MLVHVNTIEEFNKIIKEKDVIVDFYATWCGPCRMLAPVLEELSEDPNFEFDILKIDTDEIPDLAREYKIFTIPTLLLFKNGEVVNRYSGFMRKEQIIDFSKK